MKKEKKFKKVVEWGEDAFIMLSFFMFTIIGVIYGRFIDWGFVDLMIPICFIIAFIMYPKEFDLRKVYWREIK